MDKRDELNIYKKIKKANKKIININSKIKKEKGEKPSSKLVSKLGRSLFNKYYYLFMNNSRFGK